MFYYRFYTHRQINVDLETTDPRPHSRSTAHSYRLRYRLWTGWTLMRVPSTRAANSRLSTLINSHATLVLAWPGHESCELRKLSCKLSLINSHQLLFDHAELNETYSSLMINCQMRFYLATLSKSLYAQSVNRHRFVKSIFARRIFASSYQQHRNWKRIGQLSRESIKWSPNEIESVYFRYDSVLIVFHFKCNYKPSLDINAKSFQVYQNALCC